VIHAKTARQDGLGQDAEVKTAEATTAETKRASKQTDLSAP
jgi:hypothetical protein